MATTQRRTATLAAALFCAVSGCSPESHTLGNLDASLSVDGSARDASTLPDAAASIVLDKTKVDVLFVIDNSGSMEQEQQSLITALPKITRSLITDDVLGDDDPDDPSTFNDNVPSFSDVHIGVVTTDLGTANTAIQTCNLQPYGEAGILRTRGSGEGCDSDLPKFVSMSSEDDIDEAVATLSCLSNVGVNGCGFEQPLESMLMALTPSTSDLRFYGETTGSADTHNAGFLRNDSVLIVVLLTDEEDCSFADSALVDGTDPIISGTNLNLRCVLFPELLHPVSRYVDGLRALRPGRPDAVIFTAITGIPTDLAPERGSTPDYATILADARLEQVQDSSNPNQLRPSCADATRGRADPPRRIVQTAQAFGDNGFLASICQADFTELIGGIATRVRAIRERP